MSDWFFTPAKGLNRAGGQLHIAEYVDLRDLTDAHLLDRLVALPDLKHFAAFANQKPMTGHIKRTQVVARGHQAANCILARRRRTRCLNVVVIEQRELYLGL